MARIIKGRRAKEEGSRVQIRRRSTTTKGKEGKAGDGVAKAPPTPESDSDAAAKAAAAVREEKVQPPRRQLNSRQLRMSTSMKVMEAALPPPQLGRLAYRQPDKFQFVGNWGSVHTKHMARQEHDYMAKRRALLSHAR